VDRSDARHEREMAPDEGREISVAGIGHSFALQPRKYRTRHFSLHNDLTLSLISVIAAAKSEIHRARIRFAELANVSAKLRPLVS